MEARWDLADYHTVMNAIEHELELGHVEGDERSMRPTTRRTASPRSTTNTDANTDPDGENPPVIDTIIDLRTWAGLEAGSVRPTVASPYMLTPSGGSSCDSEIGRILIGEHDEMPQPRPAPQTLRLGATPRHGLRDRGCCFPGCSRIVRQCRAHHMDPGPEAATPTSTKAACSAGSITATSTNSAGPSHDAPTAPSTGTDPTASTTPPGTHPADHHPSHSADARGQQAVSALN